MVFSEICYIALQEGVLVRNAGLLIGSFCNTETTSKLDG